MGHRVKSHQRPCACGRPKDKAARHCLQCYRTTRRAWTLPIAYLTPEERRIRRLKWRIDNAKYRPSPAWRDAVRAEKALARGFRLHMEVSELYDRWAEWKTLQRLHWLQEGA